MREWTSGGQGMMRMRLSVSMGQTFYFRCLVNVVCIIEPLWYDRWCLEAMLRSVEWLPH